MLYEGRLPNDFPLPMRAAYASLAPNETVNVINKAKSEANDLFIMVNQKWKPVKKMVQLLQKIKGRLPLIALRDRFEV